MIKVMFLKELKEMLRDRKHLMVTVILPILITPLLIFAIGALQVKAAMDKESEQTRIYIESADDLPDLSAQLLAQGEFQFIDLPAEQSAQQAIISEQLDLYVTLLAKSDSLELSVLYKETPQSTQSMARLGDVVETMNQQEVNVKLEAFGIAAESVEAWLHPIQLDATNLATEKEVSAEILGTLLPFMTIIWMLSAATAIASDLVAGEKERGTLETLLISPIALLQMVIGKWLVISLSAWMSGVLTLLSMWTAFSLGVALTDDADLIGLLSALNSGSVTMVAVLMMPASGFIAAVFLVFVSFANSFKEAQSYASGLMMFMFLPLFASMTGTVELTPLVALIPILNTALMFTQVLEAQWSVGDMLIVILANAACSFAVLAVAVSMYRSESILQRR